MPPRSNDWDLVVVGAGPAGSTLGTLVKLHDPDARVLLLERASFPRHHIGESLLPGMIPVLRELGVYDRIDQAGFLRKVGVTFVWGKNRKPWDADFTDFAMRQSQRTGEAPKIPWTWQVPRARYDAMLLQNAREKGVEVWRASALEPISSQGAVRGLVVEKDGRRLQLRSRWVADCSGQSGFLPELRRSRRYRSDLKNIAAYAYFRGAKWKYRYTGHPDKTRIFLCSVPQGWFWYIPLSSELVSVGLVAKHDYFRRVGSRDIEGFYWNALKNCRELWPLLKNAALEKGMDGSAPERTFFTAGDWSFSTGAAAGPGWLAAGDAAFFIDPLLSSGVPMAHLSAQRAAYTVLSARKHADPKLNELLWSDYNGFCREVGSSFLSLVSFWYKEEPAARRWWGRAVEAIDSTAPLRFDPKSAFVAVAAGVNRLFEAAYLDRTFLAARNGENALSWRHETDRGCHCPVLFLTRGAPIHKRRSKLFDSNAVPTLLTSVQWSRRPIPIEGTGRFGVVWRAVFGARGGRDDATRFRRTLTGLHRRAIELIDGRLTVDELCNLLSAEIALPSRVIVDQTRSLLVDLGSIGVVKFKRRGQVRAGSNPIADPRMKAFRLGEELLRQGRVAEAERMLTRSVDEGLKEPWVLAVRGDARRHLGRLDTALADLDAALRPKIAGPEASIDGLADAFEDSVRRGWIVDLVLGIRAQVRALAGDRNGALADIDAASRMNAAPPQMLELRAALVQTEASAVSS